ncbi:MAG TPA: GreA/GreB family elongation factor [Kofleriaceae bacterium]|nr:GreA/GreB family elongation factor [Kofleriaceae bacterium]
MSKAFTREDDGAPEAPLRRPGLPVPVPNLVTADGLATLRAELASNPPEERARELAEHLATARTVAPQDRDVVGFGATVTVEDAEGQRARYRIVGAIESSPRDGAISWQSPVARRLLDARVGDAVSLPRGEVTVVAIDY